MRRHHQLLVVDDDPSIRETLTALLDSEGYAVSGASDAAEMEAALRRRAIDLVLLDIRLPDKDGLALTRELRQRSEIGIILITGRGDRLDRILGLEFGADDYVTKPIDERELFPRLRNLLRRIDLGRQSQPEAARPIGRLTLDLHRRRLFAEAGEAVPLTTAEFDLLAVLSGNPGRVMTRDQLIDATSRRRRDPFDRTVDSLVRRLRRKIEADPEAPQLIVTVHGTGYMFAG